MRRLATASGSVLAACAMLGASPLARAAPEADASAVPAAAGAGTGTATFRHGLHAYRLPLERVDLDEVRAAGRVEVHVALVYRDRKNRLLALAFVHRGRGPLPPGAPVDLTAATPSGASRYEARRSACDLEITEAGGGAVAGRGRCRGLVDYSGERQAPDLTELAFSARRAGRRR